MSLYESKLIGYPQPLKTRSALSAKTRADLSARKNYDNNLVVVNGHSYKSQKSGNTN